MAYPPKIILRLPVPDKPAPAALILLYRGIGKKSIIFLLIFLL